MAGPSKVQPTRQTWLVGDSDSASNRHKRFAITFGQPHYQADFACATPQRTPSRSSAALAMKGDRRWIAEGLPTPLVPFECVGCGRMASAHPRGAAAELCGCCRQREAPERGPGGADAAANLRWQASLHAKEPRPVPTSGKAPERERCARCGALQPHRCALVGLEAQFDSPEDRRRVGFVDRGVRRHQPEHRSAYHPGGWTSSGWPGAPPRTPWAAPRLPTPFSSRPPSAPPSAAASAASGTAAGSTPSGAEPPASAPREPCAPAPGSPAPSQRLLRWEERRRAAVSRAGAG
ncbi:unnamed protein product [Prorocentrum cordatum]|uniref:Uncharacterized protein n=1 Tax=Prorocentrum cordatum TaxID=2364126 RepID=A0ABN9QE23_9DINO|nr:unnamed protein product [Polarella glacialis]